MDESTTVWLVRHGLPDGSSGLCYGRHDIPLSLEGMNRAGQIARQLRGEPISHIYSSSLRRAVDTARILAEPHGLIVQTMEELREIDFGESLGALLRTENRRNLRRRKIDSQLFAARIA